MEINTSLNSSSVTTQDTTTQSTQKTQTTSSTTTTTSTSSNTDSYVSSSQTQVKGLYSKPKKLTDEQIQALKDAQAESQKQLIQQMSEALFVGQSATSKNTSTDSMTDLLKNYLSTLSDSAKLPAIVDDPEEAQKALVGDGAYSINSVATRIMDMATTLAGNDPDKLNSMRNAVIKGFSQAGITFSDITGESKLPQICQDTYTEVMKRFDALQEKYANTGTDNNTSSNTTTSSSTTTTSSSTTNSTTSNQNK